MTLSTNSEGLLTFRKYMINELAKKVHQNAKNKGFFDQPKNVGEMIALMHSELSEALEADRKDRYFTYGSIEAVNGWDDDSDFAESFRENVKGTFEEEMADVVIRVLDMCGWKGIDLESFIKAKMRYNSLREHKHGKKY